MASATSDTSTGVGQHYWTVTLTAPSGASAALQQFVTMGQDAIQTAVDLLGRGATELPPIMDDLLQTVTYQDLGTGTASTDYQALLSEIESRQTSLLSTDNQVLQASITVSAATDTTLQYIETIVNDLQSEFSSITGTLTAAENTALMQQIGDAVDMVNARVTSVYQANQSIAGSSDSNSSGTGSGSGSGSSSTGTSTSASGTGSSDSSGSNILSSLMSIIPMLAMPLVSIAPELLKDLTPKAGASGASAQSGTGKPAGAQPVGNGTAQPAAVTAPVNPGGPTAAPAAANPSTAAAPQNQSAPQS